jgi:peptidoglycan/LPS O-acetylase OafA/YrhL
MTRSSAPRFDRIDLLRGFSILSVVLFHSSSFLAISKYPFGTSLHWRIYHVIFRNEGNGVSIFFAVSGFLITLTSIRRFGSLSRMMQIKFYQVRFARVAPLLLLLLLALSVLHLANLPSFHINSKVSTLPQALFAASTFQINWLQASHGMLPPCWSVLWTLSIEEMFYLFFPIVCVVFLRGRRGSAAFVFVLICLTLFAPIARSSWYTKNELWSYSSYLANVGNIALGCLFAMLTHRLEATSRFIKSRWPQFIEMTGALLILFIVFGGWPRDTKGWRVRHSLGEIATDVMVLGIGTCLVMLGCVTRQSIGGRLTAPLRWLGRHSYEVYLTHEFVVISVLSFFFQVHRGPIGLWISAVVILSSLVGFLMARLVSEPMNRVLRGDLFLPHCEKVEWRRFSHMD